ncbi:hypothetical protein ACLOJK_000074 [Asimina triloba]
MLHSVGSPLFDSIVSLLAKFKAFYSHLKLIAQEESLSSPNNLNSSSSQAFSQMKARNNTQQVALSRDDIEMVINKLGLGSYSEKTEKQSKRIEDDGDDDFLEVVSLLLKEKEASMDELNKAFSIFDSDGDGFIDAVELQYVMAMLGFEQGTKVEECEKMIRAYDENGDGKIEFREFKNMLEDAN